MIFEFLCDIFIEMNVIVKSKKKKQLKEVCVRYLLT